MSFRLWVLGLAEVVAIWVHRYLEVLIRFVASRVQGRSHFQQPLYLSFLIRGIEAPVQSNPALTFFGILFKETFGLFP